MSVSPSGEAHSFPLDLIPDLRDLSWSDDFAADSQVVFLVSATSEDKEGKRTYTTLDGAQQESKANVAEHHSYIVTFDREGKYKEAVKVETPFSIARLGVFPSGMFLAYGFAETDSVPRLAMLKDDGTLLKFLEIPKGAAPDSAMDTKDSTGRDPAVYLAPVQFLGQGKSIYVVQNKTKLPLLEVSEGGGVRVIRPKLPAGAQINMLVPSEQNLYVIVGELGNDLMYELDQTGAVLRQMIQADGDQDLGSIGCVHDQKFLSFETGEGKLIPLVGTAEPAAGATATDSVQK